MTNIKTLTKFAKTAALTGFALSAMIAVTPALTAHAYGSGKSPATADVKHKMDHKNSGYTKVSHGSFEGRSDHVTTGHAKVVKVSNGYLLILGEDFSLDNAPAPTLGFGNDGKFNKTSQFTKLSENSGKQIYALPADFTPADFTEVYVWCSDFSVPLGVATLTAP